MAGPNVGGDVSLTVTYGGTAAETGRMDARDLAPAMYSTAMLVEHTAQLLHGSTAAVKIDVNADFRRGSFTYQLLTSPIVTDLIEPGLATAAILTVADVRTIVGQIGGLLNLLKWLRGRQATKVQPSKEQDGHVQITANDGANITVHNNVYNMSGNATIRKDVHGLIKPVEDTQGIDSVRLQGADLDGEVVIEQDDTESFGEIAAPEDFMHEAVSRELLEIVGPIFKKHLKWKFARGDGSSLSAQIHDDEWLKALVPPAGQPREEFGAGDALIVDLKTTVMRDPVTGRYRSQYEVVKVVGHIKPPQQLDLLEQDLGVEAVDETKQQRLPPGDVEPSA